MEGNRRAIAREIVVVLVVIALVLTTGGYLIGNVAAGLRALGEEQTAGEASPGPLFADLEQKLRELSGRFFPDQKAPEPQKPPATKAPEPPAPGTQARQFAEVKQVRFFEGGSDIPASKDRQYRARFSPQSRYIYAELNYKNVNHKVRDAEFAVMFQYLDDNGRLIASPAGKARPKKEWESASYAIGWGGSSGAWRTGTYTVRVIVAGEFVGEYRFAVE